MKITPGRSTLILVGCLLPVSVFAAAFGGWWNVAIFLLDATVFVLLVADILRLPGLDDLHVTVECSQTIPLGHKQKILFVVEWDSGSNIEIFPDLPLSWECRDRKRKTMLVPGKKKSVEYRVIPSVRGLFRISSLHCRSRSPLGLWHRQKNVSLDVSCTVIPNIRAVPGSGQMLTGARGSLDTSIRSRLVGHGMELAYLRDSLPDDDPRLFDWNATMRSGRMVTRVFERDAESQVVLALDCGRAMLFRPDGLSLLDHVLDAVLKFTSFLVGRKERLIIIPFAGSVLRPLTTPGTVGGKAMRRVALFLSALKPYYEEPDFRSLFEYLRKGVKKRGLLYFISETTSQFQEPFFMKELKQLALRQRTMFILARNPMMEMALEDEGRDEWERVVAMDYTMDRDMQQLLLRKSGVRFFDNGIRKLGKDLLSSYLVYKERGY